MKFLVVSFRFLVGEEESFSLLAPRNDATRSWPIGVSYRETALKTSMTVDRHRVQKVRPNSVESKTLEIPPPCFWAKSAESLENKRVEFFVPAKKRKRVRKSLTEQRIYEFFGLKRKKRPETAADESASLSSGYTT